MFLETRYRGCCDFEVEATFMDDAEECRALIERITAEHGTACQTSEIGELIQHEVLKAVALGWHEVLGGLARRDHAHGDG